MAGELQAHEITIPASADLSSFQYRAVYMRSDGSAGTYSETWTQPGGGSPAIGIMSNKPGASGRGARISMPGGVVKMEAVAAINPGDVVSVWFGGRGTPLSAGGTVAGTSWALGIAKTRAGASADLFELFYQPFYFSHA